ncbi:ADP-dependent glucokinase (ADP-GK) (ADPGK), partial [Durusdinium trenchii]
EDEASRGVESLEELEKVFAWHVARSAGGERHVQDAATFDALLRGLERLERARFTLGGNSAIMADVLVRDWGFQNVLLGGPIGERVEQLLPKELDTIGSKTDEVHLILEYEHGLRWGSAEAKRANRFIISRDEANSRVEGVEEVTSNVQGFDLLIVAGLHMLDGAATGFRKQRLGEIKASLDRVDRDTRIHFELASIGDVEVLREVAREVVPRVDSLGLNEQELLALWVALGGKDSENVAQMHPNLSAVRVVLLGLFEAFPRLERVHFHSFAVHVIAQRGGRAWRWPHQEAATAAGSVKASERASPCKK